MTWTTTDERSLHWSTRVPFLRDLRWLGEMITAGVVTPSECVGVHGSDFMKFSKTARFATMMELRPMVSLIKEVDGYTAYYGGDTAVAADWRGDLVFFLTRRFPYSVPLVNSNDPVSLDRTLDDRLKNAFMSFDILRSGMVEKGWTYFSHEMEIGFTFLNQEDAVSFTALIS